ncbi:MAG: winged helix-turn-helix domain-containing protein [Haloplanus sp.]
MDSDLDERLRALADPTRRRILLAVAETAPRSADALVDRDDAPAGAEDEQKRHIRLHHVHLPQLDEAGLVDWDRDRNQVRRGPHFEAVRPILTLLDDDPDTLTPDGSP